MDIGDCWKRVQVVYVGLGFDKGTCQPEERNTPWHRPAGRAIYSPCINTERDRGETRTPNIQAAISSELGTSPKEEVSDALSEPEALSVAPDSTAEICK